MSVQPVKAQTVPRLSAKFDFPGADGSTLAGRLELPAGGAKAYALFAHCFTCSKDVFAAARISRALAERGIAVLRFDFTGLGASDGEFANTNFSSNVADLVAAANAIAERFEAPKLLIGHSLGGAAVLAAAGDIPSVEAVATIGAPAEPGHVSHLFADSVDEIRAKGVAEVAIAGRQFRVASHFLDDIEETRLAARIRSLGAERNVALITCHAPDDKIVTIDNGEAIFAAASYPKSFVTLDGADHLLSNRKHAIYVADIIGAWTEQHLTGKPAREESPEARDVVTVTETGESKFANLVHAGRHLMTADEPPSVGGTDTGPTPYKLLLAALGACTTMTMRMYADRKGWAVGRLGVELSHDKVHAKDCEDCEEVEGKVDVIQRTLILDPDLAPDMRQKLREIADKCPVHRTLEGQPKVRTQIAGDG